MFDIKKIKQTLFLIFLGIAFFALVFLIIQQFRKSESQKILEKELKEIRTNQNKLIQNEKTNYKTIDSLKEKIKSRQDLRNVIVEKHYYEKEIINNKIYQDEKDIINSNVSFDSVKKYLSNYRFKPISGN